MANSTNQQDSFFVYEPQMGAAVPQDRFDDFRAYMRYAMQADANTPLAEYPAPDLVTTDEATFSKCGTPANALASYSGDRASRLEQFLTELQNDMATAIAQMASIQWQGQEPEKMAFVQIPQRVWRDMDDLEDLPTLFWDSGQLEMEFPMGFEDGQLIMRGKVMLFGVRFHRVLSSVAEARPVARTRAPRYDWPSFEAEAKRMIEDEGGFQPGWSQADCESRMTDWCDINWEATPSEASIRTYVKNAERKYLEEYRG